MSLCHKIKPAHTRRCAKSLYIECYDGSKGFIPYSQVRKETHEAIYVTEWILDKKAEAGEPIQHSKKPYWINTSGKFYTKTIFTRHVPKKIEPIKAEVKSELER